MAAKNLRVVDVLYQNILFLKQCYVSIIFKVSFKASISLTTQWYFFHGVVFQW